MNPLGFCPGACSHPLGQRNELTAKQAGAEVLLGLSWCFWCLAHPRAAGTAVSAPAPWTAQPWQARGQVQQTAEDGMLALHGLVWGVHSPGPRKRRPCGTRACEELARRWSQGQDTVVQGGKTRHCGQEVTQGLEMRRNKQRHRLPRAVIQSPT